MMESPFSWLKAAALAGLMLFSTAQALAAGHCESAPEIASRVRALPIVPQNPDAPRIALVVGNSQYQGLSPTPNAVNDARDVAAVLSRLGFNVICGIDLTRAEFLEQLGFFRKKLDQSGPKAVGLFFYAGHGAQRDSLNYIIPVDGRIDEFAEGGPGSESRRGLQRVETAPAAGPARGGVNFVELDHVLAQIAGAGNRQGSNYIVLDACRDNPFGQGWAKPKASFNIKGLYWAFGTGYGKTAADGEGRNGVFTKHILGNIGIKGETVEQLMKRVTFDLDRETGSSQVPETGGSLVSDFMFVPGARFVLNATVEEISTGHKLVFGLVVAMTILLIALFYYHRYQTAWMRGLDLSQKLVIDSQILEEVKKKSRLVSQDIVGYLKDVREKKLVALVTPKYDLVLGRSHNVNVVLLRSTISGQHAQLGWDRQRGGFWIEDLGSRNGTWWGKGKRIEPGKRYPLESGQVFYLADEGTPLMVISHRDGIDGAGAGEINETTGRSKRTGRQP